MLEAIVRPANADDADIIDAIHRAAFAGTQFGYQGEAELVRMLEADGDVLSSIVVEQDGVVIGHIMFSRMTVKADGIPLSAAGLAPVAILPEFQAHGLGGKLITTGLSLLREQAVQISFVLGDERYYPRFGYSAELAARFASPFAGPHFMAMMLDSDAKWPQGGRADYAPALGRLG